MAKTFTFREWKTALLRLQPRAQVQITHDARGVDTATAWLDGHIIATWGRDPVRKPSDAPEWMTPVALQDH